MNVTVILDTAIKVAEFAAAGGCIAYTYWFNRVLSKQAGKEIADAAIAYADATRKAPAEDTNIGLVAYETQSPLSKEQFLLAVSLCAQSQARFYVLTRYGQNELAQLKEKDISTLISCSGFSSSGADLYGIHKIFLKYPDVTPAEFIEAYDRAYESSIKDTVNAIMAATTAAA